MLTYVSASTLLFLTVPRSIVDSFSDYPNSSHIRRGPRTKEPVKLVLLIIIYDKPLHQTCGWSPWKRPIPSRDALAFRFKNRFPDPIRSRAHQKDHKIGQNSESKASLVKVANPRGLANIAHKRNPCFKDAVNSSEVLRALHRCHQQACGTSRLKTATRENNSLRIAVCTAAVLEPRVYQWTLQRHL